MATVLFFLHGKVINGSKRVSCISRNGIEDNDIHRNFLVSHSGWSISLSSDARILAVGGPLDGPSYAPRIGSTWLFQFNESTGTYHQLGHKLVGARYLGYSSQGKHGREEIVLLRLHSH